MFTGKRVKPVSYKNDAIWFSLESDIECTSIITQQWYVHGPMFILWSMLQVNWLLIFYQIWNSAFFFGSSKSVFVCSVFYESQKYVCLQTAVVEENVKSQVKNTFIRIKQYFSKGTPASTFCIHHRPRSVRRHHITLNPSLRNTFWSKQPDARVRKKPLASC